MRNIILFCVASIAVGCNKGYKEFRITDSVLKQTLDFKEGSFLVYKDLTTGKLDTCKLAFKESGMQSDDETRERYECLETRFTAANPWDLYWSYGAGCAVSRMDKITVLIQLLESDGKQNIFYATVFSVPQQSDSSPYKVTYKGFSQSLLIDTVSYDSVYEYESDRLGVLSRSYFSLKYGIVRLTTVDSNGGYAHDWILINSKIIKD